MKNIKKSFIYTTNLMVLVTSIGLILSSIYWFKYVLFELYSFESNQHILKSIDSYFVLLVLILIGIFLLIGSIIGFIWIYDKNFLAFGIYLLILAIGLIVLLANGICALILSQHDFMLNKLQANLQREFTSYKETRNETKFDYLQKSLKCCGMNNYLDWRNQTNLNPTVETLNYKFLLNYNQIWFNIPDSCCTKSSIDCGKHFNSYNTTIYTNGCLKPMGRLIHLNYLYISFTCFLSFFILLACLAYFLLISFTVKNDYYLLVSQENI